MLDLFLLSFRVFVGHLDALKVNFSHQYVIFNKCISDEFFCMWQLALLMSSKRETKTEKSLLSMKLLNYLISNRSEQLITKINQQLRRPAVKMWMLCRRSINQVWVRFFSRKFYIKSNMSIGFWCRNRFHQVLFIISDSSF